MANTPTVIHRSKVPTGLSRSSQHLDDGGGAWVFENVDDLRQGVAAFIDAYNNEWLIERLGHRTLREAFRDAMAAQAA
jgi:hypothetical protein